MTKTSAAIYGTTTTGGILALFIALSMLGAFNPKLTPHEKAQIRAEAYAELQEHTHFPLDSAFVFGYISAFANEHEKGNAVLLSFDYWGSPRIVAMVDTTGDTTIVTAVGQGLFEAVGWAIWRPDNFIEASLDYKDPNIDSLLSEPYRLAKTQPIQLRAFHSLPYLAKVERRYETGVLLQHELAPTRLVDVAAITALELEAYQTDYFLEFDYAWADTVLIANEAPYIEVFIEMRIVGWHVWDGQALIERHEFPINWTYVMNQGGE